MTADELPAVNDQSVSLIRVACTDRIEFLQGQLTNDLQQLTPDKPLLAGWNSAKGRLLCVMWAIDWQESVGLIVPTELTETIAKRLKMYVLRSDVEITIPDWPVSVSAADRLDSLSEPKVVIDDKPIGICLYNDSSFFLTHPYLDGIGLHGSTDTDSPAATDADWLEWRRQNIAAGIPSVWQNTSGEFVPQMVNLDLLNGINFEKGCYVGQEIVARTQNLGRIKRRMFAYQATCSNLPDRGDAIYAAGKSVGQIVDSAGRDGGCQFLAVVRLDSMDSQLTLDQAGEIQLQSVPLPYEIPETSA